MDTRIETLKSLHRGEIAATETYVEALDKLHGPSDTNDLTAIRNDHRDFANELRQHVHQLGLQPDQDSGVWGTWSKFMESTAAKLGRKAALMALKEGEELEASCYESALDIDIPDECKTAIRDRLLPKTRDHISMLDQLMEVNA